MTPSKFQPSTAAPIDLAKLRSWMTSLSETVRCSADPVVANNPHAFVLAENSRAEEDTLTIGDVLELLDVADAAVAWEAGHATEDFRELCRNLKAAIRSLRKSDVAKLRAWMAALFNTVRAYTNVAYAPGAYVLVESRSGNTITIGDVLTLLNVADAAIAWEAGHAIDDFRELCRNLKAAIRSLRGESQ